MFGSPHRRRQPPLLDINTDKERLCRIEASLAAKQVERHHFFSCISLRDYHMLFEFFHFFDFFDFFSILNPMVSYLSITAHSFDILMPVAAHHHPSDPPELVFTSAFLCFRRYIAAARFSTCGEEILGIPWRLAGNRAGPCNMAIYNRMGQ